MNELKLCEKIARKAHEGQKRRDGSDYITHPERVAKMFSNNELLACLAWLHDVIEDTDETAQSLVNQGVSTVTVSAVVMLTKLPETMQTYEQYIKNIRSLGGVARVKVADMVDNLCDNPTDKQKAKYRKAMAILLPVI